MTAAAPRAIRWGIAGCGWVARDYVAPAITASGNGSLAALHDLSPVALSRAAALFPAATAFADPAAFFSAIDAVYVASPNDAHRPLVEAAAAARVPVLCEKPMATTLADARAIVAACEGVGIPYATAFDQRFHPAHIHLAELVRGDVLGTVTAIRIAYCCWVGPDFQGDNWRIDPARAGGGALMDLAPHGLDLAATLLGERLVDVAAMGQSRVHDYAVEDGAMLVARTAGGVLVQLHVAYNCPEQLPATPVGGGRHGSTGGRNRHDGPNARRDADAHRRCDRHCAELHVPGADRSPFLNQVEAFADALLTGRPFAFPPDGDLAIMELVMRAQAQARPMLRKAA